MRDPSTADTRPDDEAVPDDFGCLEAFPFVLFAVTIIATIVAILVS